MFFFTLVAHATTYSGENDLLPIDKFPIPGKLENLMFYIQRDPNTNTICYSLNLDHEGKIIEKEPIKVFWIRYPEGGQIKDLNYIQRKFAYGINSKKTATDLYDLRSVAYNKLPLILKKDASNKYHVYTKINKVDCIVERIFIRIDGGTMWSPNVLFIELKGTDPLTGKKQYERFKPL
jgi:hypothetical protein